MYKQGRRFAEGSSSKVTAFDLAAMQARSYLAAINALTLVDKRNAWIALPSPTKSTRVCLPLWTWKRYGKELMEGRKASPSHFVYSLGGMVER
jgi:hypothetical protein